MERSEAKRVAEILRRLDVHYPDVRCALHFRNKYELLVAVMLSAQCTDKVVNTVTPALFARYPDVAALAEADLETLERLVYKTGFYRNKARHLKGMAQDGAQAMGRRDPQHRRGVGSAPRRGPKDGQRRDERLAQRALGNRCGYPRWAHRSSLRAERGEGAGKSGRETWRPRSRETTGFGFPCS
ncbi:MAG: hypothetical protein KatS3mg115_2274 [Candidatus Poribacteria bacterium]|nr:MAG: hypothetical protein KatS3mg115_2274 [Candidatus Poribacteria bacterium]